MFPGVSVIPTGSCTDVQRSVEGLRNANAHHHVRAYGLIDRDTRSNAEVSELESKGVFALDAYSAESLYYCSASIDAVARRQATSINSDPVALARSAKQSALECLSDSGVAEHMAARRCEGTVRRMLVEQAPSSKAILQGTVRVDPIDVDSVNSCELDRYKAMLAVDDIDGLAARYPIRESRAPKCISSALGYRDHHVYERAVVTRVRNGTHLQHALLQRVHALAKELRTPMTS